MGSRASTKEFELRCLNEKAKTLLVPVTAVDIERPRFAFITTI